MKGFEKWDKHKIGDVEWIRKHKSHPHRNHFIDYAIANDSITSILEIGGGELMEAKVIIKKNDNIRYTVADVSSSFLKHAKKRGIKRVEASMHKLPFKDNQFDLVYLSSVIEHSPDIKKTIKEICRVSKSYYITMFKWRMISGGLTPLWKDANESASVRYKERKINKNMTKRYYSTYFNLPSLIELLKKHSTIEDMNVSIESDSDTMSYERYKKNIIMKADIWRCGDRLNIIGSCNTNELQ
jgi:ubiquinone/menaquinone biosynthesis C-methylase UbiE